MTYFLFGSWRHAPVRSLVLGREAEVTPAQLMGWTVRAGPEGQAVPMAVSGSMAEGLVLQGLTTDDLERIGFVSEVFGLSPVHVGDGAVLPLPATAEDIRILQPSGASAGPDAWSLHTWVARHAAATERLLAEMMPRMGHADPAQIRQHLMQARVRGTSWARALVDSTPAAVRRGGTADDVRTEALRRPYTNFFQVEEQDLRFRRFDGSYSAPVTRAAFVMGDAVTVLPYDPVRDRVLLVEQFRFGPLARGDRNPWSLEPVAGRIDPGEPPEETARREAREEAGLDLAGLELVARYYPSPGAVTEYLWSFVGLADLPDEAAVIGGLDSEDEDIRGLVLSFDAAMDLVTGGEAENGPLILSLLWLARNRDRLRQGA